MDNLSESDNEIKSSIRTETQASYPKIERIRSQNISIPQKPSLEPYKNFMKYEDNQRRKNLEDNLLSRDTKKREQRSKDTKLGTTAQGFYTARAGLQSSQSSAMLPSLNFNRDSILSPSRGGLDSMLTSRAEKNADMMRTLRNLKQTQSQGGFGFLGQDQHFQHTYRAPSQKKDFEAKLQHNIQNLNQKQENLVKKLKTTAFDQLCEKTKKKFERQQLATQSIPKLIKCADRVLNKRFVKEEKDSTVQRLINDELAQDAGQEEIVASKNDLIEQQQERASKILEKNKQEEELMKYTFTNFGYTFKKRQKKEETEQDLEKIGEESAKRKDINTQVFQYTEVETKLKTKSPSKNELIEVESRGSDITKTSQRQKQELNIDLRDIVEDKGKYFAIKNKSPIKEDQLQKNIQIERIDQISNPQVKKIRNNEKNSIKQVKFYRQNAKNYFFPLEIFDDEARDDPDPEIMILNSNQIHGFSRFTTDEIDSDVQYLPFGPNQAKVKWERCRIIGYDPTSKLFEIKFVNHPQSKVKQVKRLNLAYEYEDLQKHEKRIQIAREKQKVHECLVRYTGNLMKKNNEISQSKEALILIRPQIIENIIILTNEGYLNKIKNDVDEKSAHNINHLKNLRKLTRDFLKFYRFTVVKDAFDQENMNKKPEDYFLAMQEKEFWSKMRFIRSIIYGSRRTHQVKPKSKLNHLELKEDLKRATLQATKKRITDNLFDLMSYTKHTRKKMMQNDGQNISIVEEDVQNEIISYSDSSIIDGGKLTRQRSEEILTVQKAGKSDDESSEYDIDQSEKDEFQEEDEDIDQSNGTMYKIPDFEENEDEKEFKEKIALICIDIDRNRQMNKFEKQSQLMKQIIAIFKDKRRANCKNLEKLRPKNLALVHVIFPKIIRYIKSISEISFFKGLQIIHDKRQPLSLKKFEDAMLSKQQNQISKVENICKTAENTLNNMIYDLVNQCHGDMNKRNDLFQRFNRLTRISNIFLESTLKVSIAKSFEEGYQFMRRYYAVLPLSGIYNNRILQLCEDYIIIQLNEQRKALEMSAIPELGDRLKEISQREEMTIAQIQKHIERKRTISIQQFRKQQSMLSNQTVGSKSLHEELYQQSSLLKKVSSMDEREEIIDSENLVKESIVFINKQYQQSSTNTFQLVFTPDRNPLVDETTKFLNIMYKWHLPYQSMKIAPLIRIEIISRRRFTILKRTLLTPKLLRPGTIVDKKKIQQDDDEDEDERKARKEEEKLKKKNDIISNSLFGKKLKESRNKKTFKIPHLKGPFTISIGDFKNMDQDRQASAPDIEPKNQEEYQSQDDSSSDQSFNDLKIHSINEVQPLPKLKIMEDDNIFLVQKVKKITVTDIFGLISKEKVVESPDLLFSRTVSNASQTINESMMSIDPDQRNQDIKEGQQDIIQEQPQDIISRYFPWYDEDNFQDQAIFFKPTFKTMELKLKQLLIDPIQKLQMISNIRAPEIIEQPFKKNDDDLMANQVQDLEKLQRELETVICYSIVGPLSILGMLRQYDYLVLYQELDYLQTIQTLADDDEIEILYNEFKLLKQDEYEIDMRFPNELSFGCLVVDIIHLKRELINSANHLATSISHQIKRKFLNIQEVAWKKFEEIRKRLMQSIDTKEIFIDIKKYINNSNLENDIEVLKNHLKKCKKLESLFQKFYTYIDPIDYEKYWLSYQWEWRVKSFKEETIFRMNRCIERFKQEVIQEADMVKNQIGQMGRIINSRFKFHQDMENAESYAQGISDIVEKLKAYKEKAIKLNEQEVILGLPPTDYSEIADYLNVGEPLKTLWIMVKNWHIENDKYMNLYFSDLNKDEIEQMVRKTYETIDELDEKLNFEETNNPKTVLERILKELDDFCENCMPVIIGLISEKIRQRHWNELRDHLYANQINNNLNTGLDGDLNAVPQLKANEITLKYLIEENIITLIPIIQQIREKAEKEYENEIYIENLTQEIKNYQVEFITTKDGNILIKNAREHTNTLQDYNFNSKIKLKNDIYILPFEEHLKELQFKLKTMKHYMEQVDRLQKNYIILSDAFRLREIQLTLANEWKDFEEIDKEFYERLKQNTKMPNFLQNVTEEDYLRLRLFNEKLRNIRINFKKFFSEKREKFPRFFFLSDQQIMNLTCSQNNPKYMNTYLRYCFRGVKELMLDENQENIIGCLGVKNENVLFQDVVPIKGIREIIPTNTDVDENDSKSDIPQHRDEEKEIKYNIDICIWMQELENQLRWTMKNVIRRCIIERDDSHIEEWLYNQSFNEQTYLVVEAIKFNYDVVSIFNQDGIQGLQKYAQRLRRYAKTIVNFIHFDELWAQKLEIYEESQAPSPDPKAKLRKGVHQSKGSLHDISSMNGNLTADKSKPLRQKTMKAAKIEQHLDQNMGIELQKSEDKKDTQPQPTKLDEEKDKLIRSINKQKDEFRSSRRIVFESLYLQKLNQIEILEVLISNQVQDLTCFEWLSQLKFALEIEAHRIDEKQQQLENHLQSLKKQFSILEQLTIKDAREQRFIEAANQQKKISQMELDRKTDNLTNVIHVEEEEKNQISLGVAMRKRIRMEVEAQALRAEKEKLSVEKILKLSKLYQSVLDVNEDKVKDVYFEYSADYSSLKREKKDYSIVAYMLCHYQQYGFEFNPTEGSVLVYTPQTQKCLYNLFQSVSLQVGGLIYGSQGVGKTETIKSFARSLAKPFIMWSCRGGCSYNGLSRIFAGMAIGGWWLCLDEINQLEIQILSTLIQQILNIKHAVMMHKNKIEVNLSGGSTEVPFNREFGVFATYTHQDQVPQNKILFRESKRLFGVTLNNFPHILFENFRTIHMFNPDTRVLLTAQLSMLGFNNPLGLSGKIYTCLQLLSENMTPYHSKSKESFKLLVKYPLNLRTIEIIVQKLKFILRTFVFKQDTTEDYIVANSLRGTFFYQFNPNQTDIVDSIVANVFNTQFNDIIAYSFPRENRMNEILNTIIATTQIIHSDQLLIKSKQFLNSIGATIKSKEARNQQSTKSILLIGRSMSGKTELIQLVAKAFYKFTKKHFNIHRFNVDSQNLDQFYGYHDTKQQWQEGLLPSLILKCLTKLSEEQQKFLNEDNYKSIFIGDRSVDILKASTNINELKPTKKLESFFKNTQLKSQHTQKKAVKKSKNIDFSLLEKDLIKRSLFATQRDWILLDGQVKENFHNSIQINWFERFLTLTERESEFLCQSNGDSIHSVNSELKYIIETQTIYHISPAIMNRCQIIYIDKDIIDDITLFSKYILSEKFPAYFKPHASMMLRLFNRIFKPFLEFLREHEQFLLFQVRQQKMIVSDMMVITEVMIDELLKALICNKRIDIDRLEDEFLKNENDSQRDKEKSLYSVISNLNLFDKFQIKYSMRSKKNQEFEQTKLTHEQELACLQSAFMESMKFVISNYISPGFHSQVAIYLKTAIKTLISDGKIDDKFAFGFIDVLNAFDSKDHQQESFFMNQYFDYSSLIWQSFDIFNPFLKYCTHSGEYQKGRRRFSISEEYRLNSQYRETKNHILTQNEIDRKVNQKFDACDELEFLYFDKSSMIRRNNYYYRLLQSHHKSIMVMGPIQSGKTSMIRNKIQSDMKFRDFRLSNISRYIPYVMNPLTKVTDLKRIVESNMEVQRAGVYVPPSKQHTYLFIDDLNMSNIHPDKDSSSPLELLREYFELGGWYSKNQQRFNYVQQMHIIISYTLGKRGDRYLIKSFNERIMRHFVKLQIQSINKFEMGNIFMQYVDKAFDQKHDKNLYEISKKVMDTLSVFMFKNYEKFYCDTKAFGINLSIQSTVTCIRKFVQIDYSKIKSDKQAILKTWFDLIKRQYLYQFPLIFQSVQEQKQFNDKIFDNRYSNNADFQQKDNDSSFNTDLDKGDDKSIILSSSEEESDQSNTSHLRIKIKKSNHKKKKSSDLSSNNFSDREDMSEDESSSKFSKKGRMNFKLQSFNNKVRQYILKISTLLYGIAQDFMEEKSPTKSPRGNKNFQPPVHSGIVNSQASKNKDIELMLMKQQFIVNNDIFERLDEQPKNYEYDIQIMEEDHFKLINREMRNQFKKFIFQDDCSFKHEFLRMDNALYDKMVKTCLDLMRQLEELQGHVVLKANYEVDSSFLVFICRVCAQFLRYTPYFINLSSPEFSFSEFIRDFNSKLEENVFRKKTKMILIVEMENYNLNHQLNDEHRQESIANFLYFLQALATGSRFQNLLNYQEMKINLDKIRLREYTQQTYDFDNFNEEQILYCLNSDITRNIKIIFTSNHSRGSFMIDQILMHQFRINDDNQDNLSLETLGYLANYCKDLFLMTRVIHVDFMHYLEENMIFIQQSNSSQFKKKKESNFKNHHNEIKKNKNILGQPEKVNIQYFRNPFKLNEQKYDRIIDSAYVTARKIQNIVNDIQQWEIDSSLEQDKQQVYYLFEKLMTRYYRKHYQRKRNILDYLVKFKNLTDEIKKIKEETKEQKDKMHKNREDRNESNRTIEDNKKQIEYNKKKSTDLMKKSTDRLNSLFKERKFKMMDLEHLESKFSEEYEFLKKTTESEYDEFLQNLRTGKAPQLIVSQHLALMFILMFGTEKMKRKPNVKMEKVAPKFYLQKYSYQKFIEDLGVFSLQKKFASENIFKLQQLYEQASELISNHGKVITKFQKLSLSWFVNAINYSKMKAQLDEIQIDFERDLMEAEDQRSRAINLIAINQQRSDEIKILDKFSKKLEKKIRKITSSIQSLKDIGKQLKDIKRDLASYVKKWKVYVVDQAAPFDMTEGNMLYIALYFVFVMKFPSVVSSYLRDYILNLMLEWDLKFNIQNAIFQFVNLETKNFQEECSLYGIEENQRLYENLALIKLVNKFKLPFPFIYDPLGIAFKYITNLEAPHQIETEMITIIEADDLDESNLKNNENRVFQYYQERYTKNETTFEKLVRCMENGTPIILKDVDVKALKLVDSLIQWRYKNYLRDIRGRYYGKENDKDFDSKSNIDLDQSHQSNQPDSVSEKESAFSQRILSDNFERPMSNNGTTQPIPDEEEEQDIDTIHFNKAFVTIKKSFRLYLVFSSKNFQNIENYYRQRTTFVNLAVEDDQDLMKDIVLDILMQQFQFEPYIISYLLKGHNFRIQREQLKREKIFLRYFKRNEFNFRDQETINTIKNLIKSLKEIQQQKLKFVLENQYLKKYKALFEKVQKEIEEEEQKEENAIKENKHNRPASGELKKQQPSKITRKGKKSVHRATSFDQDNLLQFYLKSPSQVQNKAAFEKLYKEILDSNNKQKIDFRQKIMFATEPVYILWKTTQDVRASLGNLYNFTDNYFKLLIKQTAQELYQLSVTFSNSSSKRDLSNITENLVLRIMHKLISGLRKDHKVIFMFIFSVKLLQNEHEAVQSCKKSILDKIDFLFNGLQIYQGDLLAINYEQKDFYRDPKWDYTKHRLQDYYQTIEGKILPLVTNKDILRAQPVLKAQNLSYILDNMIPRDNIEIIRNLKEILQQSPDALAQKLKRIETGSQKIVKRIGGNVYRAFQVESLIAKERRQQIYKDEMDHVRPAIKRKGSVGNIGNASLTNRPIRMNTQKVSKGSNTSQNQFSKTQTIQNDNFSFSNMVVQVQKLDTHKHLSQQDNSKTSQMAQKPNLEQVRRRASIIRKESDSGEVPPMVAGLKRRSTITEGFNRNNSRSTNLKTLVPGYHFEAISSLISNFLETFLSLENDIVAEKEKWLNMFFHTPSSQDFDPFDFVPKLSKSKMGTPREKLNQQDPIDQLLLLFVTKSETISKAIDNLIKHALDPIFHYTPKHIIEIHATLEWFKRPTIIFYNFGSSSPVQRIMNASKKAFRQTIRISCGKSNFEIIKLKILQAARGGNWLIIENLQMLPEQQILKILKFIYDRIVYVRQSFPNLRIWITYYTETFSSEEYRPLDLKQSLSTKLFQLTNDCFKIFINSKQGLKEQMMSLYEPEVGYILHNYEEHFYTVLMPKEPSNEKEIKFKQISDYWERLIKDNVVDVKRRDLVNRKPKQKFLKRINQALENEMQLNFKFNMLIAILDERNFFERDQYVEFFNERFNTTSKEDFMAFQEQLWFMVYFINKGKRGSKELLQKQIENYTAVNDQNTGVLSTGIVRNLFNFMVNKVGDYTISAHKKHCYYLYGVNSHENRLNTQEFKRNINLMPEQDQLSILGVSLNQGLARLYIDTKNVLMGVSIHFTKAKQYQKQDQKLRYLFELDRDQLTLENRELLLIGFNKELDSFNSKQNIHKQKINQKEDYCFGDVDKIVELYIQCFNQRNIDEINGFESKLNHLIKQMPSAQKYLLYKDRDQKGIQTLNNTLQGGRLLEKIETNQQTEIINQAKKTTLKLQNEMINVELIKDLMSENQSPGSKLKGYQRNAVMSPQNASKFRQEKLKQQQKGELSLLRKLYYDTVQSKEQQNERVYIIINFVNELLPKTLEYPQFSIKLAKNAASLDEEQSADEEEEKLAKELITAQQSPTISPTKEEQKKMSPQSLRESRRKSNVIPSLQINLPGKTLEQKRPTRLEPKLTVQTANRNFSSNLAPQTPQMNKELTSPASPNVVKFRNFTLSNPKEVQTPTSARQRSITQALSQFDYQFKYKNFSGKNEQIFRNFYFAELIQMNKIIKKINKELSILKNYLQGIRIKSLDIKDLDLYECLLNNEVPGSWLKSGFFCKIKITLVEWLELLTSKYAYLERWAIESKGNPPPVLKLAIVMNPFNLMQQMLADYANCYSVSYNILGLIMYLPKNQPANQQQSRGIYLEGITLRNGHINFKTGELERAMTREFEQELPVIKMRVSCIRRHNWDAVESVPIVIRGSEGKGVQRFGREVQLQAQFQNQGTNHAQSILLMMEKLQEDQVVPLEPASPFKPRGSFLKVRIKDLITDVADKESTTNHEENQISLQFHKINSTPAHMIQSPMLKSSLRSSQLQVISHKATTKTNYQTLNTQGPKLKGRGIKSSFKSQDQKHNLLKSQSDKHKSDILQISKIQSGGAGLLQLHEIESESSFDSDNQDLAEKKGDKTAPNQQHASQINLLDDFNLQFKQSNIVSSSDNLLTRLQSRVDQVSEDVDNYFQKVFFDLRNENKFKENDGLIDPPPPKLEFEDNKPERKQVKMFDELPEDSILRYEIVCPLIGQIQSNNLFKIKYHFRFRSRYPQSYWNSVGLIAYFNNIKTL